MEADLKNISKIETFLDSLFGKEVSDNTFYTDLPPAINRKWADMMLVDCEVTDLNAYGSGYVYLYLYTKPMQNGTKDVPHISQMESKLNGCLASNKDKHYKLSVKSRDSDYDDKRNLFINVIILDLIIT